MSVSDGGGEGAFGLVVFVFFFFFFKKGGYGYNGIQIIIMNRNVCYLSLVYPPMSM